MKVERFNWTVPEDASNTVGICLCTEHQPTIGISGLWNEPGKWYKPCIIFWLGYWCIQVGWMM